MRACGALEVTPLTISGGPQSALKMLGVLVHVAILMLALAGNDNVSRQDRGRARRLEKPIAAVLLVPPRKQIDARSRGIRSLNFLDSSNAASVNVDLDGLKIGIETDYTFQLIKVLAIKNGLIGIADRREPHYIKSFFVPPHWHAAPNEDWLARDSFFAIRIDQPRQWVPLSHVLEQYGIGTEQQVYALLPLAFRDELLTELHRQVTQLGGGRILAARIQFNSHVASGFTITNVTFASNRKPVEE